MKAVRIHECGDPSVLKLESSVPKPARAAGQVLIKTKSIGVVRETQAAAVGSIAWPLGRGRPRRTAAELHVRWRGQCADHPWPHPGHHLLATPPPFALSHWDQNPVDIIVRAGHYKPTAFPKVRGAGAGVWAAAAGAAGKRRRRERLAAPRQLSSRAGGRGGAPLTREHCEAGASALAPHPRPRLRPRPRPHNAWRPLSRPHRSAAGPLPRPRPAAAAPALPRSWGVTWRALLTRRMPAVR
jgi:hypothetical protein